MQLETVMVKRYEFTVPGRPAMVEYAHPKVSAYRELRRIAPWAALVRRYGGTVAVSWHIAVTNDHMSDAAQRRWESAVCDNPRYWGI